MIYAGSGADCILCCPSVLLARQIPLESLFLVREQASTSRQQPLQHLCSQLHMPFSMNSKLNNRATLILVISDLSVDRRLKICLIVRV